MLRRTFLTAPLPLALSCSQLPPAWPDGKKVALSLTFDDARASQIDVGLPLFQKIKLPATWYVLPDKMEKQLKGWKEMIALGNQEIGNHSTTHPCSINFRPGAKGLEGMTLEELGRDLDKANEEIRRMTGLTPVSFAYPCGQSTVGRGEGVQSYVPLIAKRFTSGRGYYDEMGNYPFVCDFAKLLGLATDDMDFAGMKRLIETARNSSRWVIFCGHEIGPRKFQSTEAEALRALADYVNDPANGVWVDTVGNITSHVRKLQGV